MKRNTITKLDVLSVVKTATVIGALIGLVLGVLYGIGGAIYDLFTIGLNYGSLLALQAIIGMPILFAGAGFVCGLVGAVLFNIAAKLTGGVTISEQAARQKK